MKKKLIIILTMFILAFNFSSCNKPKNDIENLPPNVVPEEPVIPDIPDNPDIPNVPDIPEDEISLVYKVQVLVALNIRQAPSTSSNILGKASEFEYLPYINTDSDWYKIKYNEEIGYVSANASYSKIVDINQNFNPVDNIISVGMSLLGTPYEFGATRLLDWDYTFIPSFTGKTFDCSSFVQYSYYTGAKVKLQGNSRSQSQQGVEISQKNMRRGDLLFMYSSSRVDNVGIERIGHVAIYLGNNQILHTFGTGGVRVQEFTEFWRERVIVVKRML